MARGCWIIPCPLLSPAVCPPRRPGVDWTQELPLHLKWHHPGASQERDINFPQQPTLCALEPCCLCHRIPIFIYNPTKNTESKKYNAPV